MVGMTGSTRRAVIAGATAYVASGPLGARSAPARPRIGLMLRAGNRDFLSAFIDELARLGFVDGRTLTLETRLAEPDLSNVPAQVRELAGLDLALIVVGSTTWADAIIRAMPAMPVVIVTAAAMVASGYAKSLARPGGHVTGGEELPPGLTATRIALLKQAAPDVSQIGLLAAYEDAAYRIQLADALAAAKRLGLAAKPYPAPSPRAIEVALDTMVADGIDGLVNFQSGFSLAHRQFIVDFAARHRLPAIYQASRFVDAGGLMAWSPDQDEQFRAAARTAAKVLRGAKVGDIPIHYPPRYYLTINAAAARRLGLKLPPALLRRADRVIDPRS